MLYTITKKLQSTMIMLLHRTCPRIPDLRWNLTHWGWRMKKMSNKYKEAVGIWKHTIGNITHELTPEEDDNYRFLSAKNESQKKEDGTILFRRVGELYFDMVLRANPSYHPILPFLW